MDRHKSNWDKSNFLKNSLILSIGQFSSALFSALFIWLLKYFEFNDFLSQIIIFITINQLCLLFINWTQPLYIRDGLAYYNNTQKLNHLFFSRLLFTIGLGLILICSSFFWDKYLSAFLNTNLIIIRFSLIFFIIQIVFWHLHNSLQSIKLIKAYSFMLFIDKLTPLILFLIFWYLNQINLNTLLISIISGNILAIIYGYIKLKKYIKISFSLKSLKLYLKDSTPLIATVFVSFLTTGAIDQFFIKHYLSQIDLINYYIIFQFYGMYLQIPTLLSSLFLNWITSCITENKDQTLRLFFTKFLPQIVIIYSLLSIMVFYVISFVLKYFYKLNNDEFLVPLSILIITSIFAFINIIAFSPFILAQRIIKLSMIISIIGAAINILGNFILIKDYGIIGVSLSTFLSISISLIIIHIYTFNRYAYKEYLIYSVYIIFFLFIILILKYSDKIHYFFAVVFSLLISMILFEIKKSNFEIKNFVTLLKYKK